ncbi:MAG: lipocalin-like domain-containing protein [Nitrospirae bacterium]|nr:lipocalin-like domain-containing protein [Nitrospirota bacterium]
MKWSIKEVASVLLVVAVLAFGMLSGASKVCAAEKGAGLAKQIHGSWTLISNYNEVDGKKTDFFGPNPKGFMTLTPEGHFSMMFIRAGLPKFASNNRMKGTAEENQAIVQGTNAYYGTYSVVGDTVNLHIEAGTFPNWDGQDQKRPMTLTGDELNLINPTPSSGSGKNYITWKRAK